MRYLLVYHSRLRDILRLFPACRHLAAQGHDVSLECEPPYHDIFACVDYVRPVAPGADRGGFDRVLELGIDVVTGGSVHREREYRSSGSPWAEFVYRVDEIAGSYGPPVFTDIQFCTPADYGLPINGDYAVMAPMGSRLHCRYDPAKLGAWCQQHWPKKPLLVLIDREDKKFPPFLRARRLRDLPAIISWPSHFASVNSTAAVIAAAVRKSYVHFPEQGIAAQDDVAFVGISQVVAPYEGERSAVEDDVRLLRARIGPRTATAGDAMRADEPLRVSFFTTLDHNVGDEFIREGIRAAFEAAGISYEPYFICKHKPETVSKVWPGEAADIGDKYWNADVVVQAGAPVYWHLIDGKSTSLTSEWHDWFWLRRVLGPPDRTHPLFLNLGAGSCFNWGDKGDDFVTDVGCGDFARRAGERAELTVVREAVASDVLRRLGVKHEALPCPAFLAGARHRHTYRVDGRIGVNLMPLGGHFELDAGYRQSKWIEDCLVLLRDLRSLGQLTFIAHNEEEEKFLAQLSKPGEVVFRGDTWRAYLDAFAQCAMVVANRVHAAVCASGLGVPAMILGNDTRAEIGRLIGLPIFRSGHASGADLGAVAAKLWVGRGEENARLLALRAATIERYAGLLRQIDFAALRTRRARLTRNTDRENAGAGAPAARMILFSKADALGDQVLGSGLVRTLVDEHPGHHLIWLVRDGIDAVGDLFDGARVWSPSMHRAPEAEAGRLCGEYRAGDSGWARVTIVPVPLHPYGARPAAADAVTTWWAEFVRALKPELAVAGSATVNWVDQFLVGASAAPRRVGCELRHDWQRLAAPVRELFPSGVSRPFTEQVTFDAGKDELGHFEDVAAAILGRRITLQPALAPRPATLSKELLGALRDALLVAPGAGAAGRALPVATAADAIAAFLKSAPSAFKRCVVVEGPGDHDIVEQLCAQLSARRIEHFVFVLRSNGLAMLMAVLRSARLFLCNETSYVHLAAFVGTPTVAIWGLGHWPRFVCREGAVTIVRTEMACKGCDWACCFEKWNCVQLIPAVAVARALVRRAALKGDRKIDVQIVPSAVPEETIRAALARKQSQTTASVTTKAKSVVRENAGQILAEGDVLFGAGKYAEARSHYQRALAAEPSSLPTMTKLAATCLRLDDRRNAEVLLAQVFAREANHVEALRVSAEFAVRSRNGHLALQLYTRMLAVVPKDVDVHFQIGRLHVLAGRRSEARKAFAVVLELEPAHAAARQQLMSLESAGVASTEPQLSTVP